MDPSRQTEPLARDPENGTPHIFAALGAYYYLEALTPEHLPLMEEATALIFDWIGGSLQFTYNSAFPVIEPFRPADLDYAPGFLRLLNAGGGGLPDPMRIQMLNNQALLISDFSLDCHGGAEPNHASPYQYRFFGTIGDDEEIGKYLPSRITLRVSVPVTTPVEDFRQRALALARLLPLRWGTAGLVFAGWEHTAYTEVESAMFALARRYPGFDTCYDAPNIHELYRALRTVSWLTFVGPALRQDLARKEAVVASTDAVTVSDDGANLVLQAGPAPEAGDINRLQAPRGYVQADALLRKIRQKAGINFFDDWDEATTGEWLTRFERRMS